jgi:methyl-accepting chemotaxis protein
VIQNLANRASEIGAIVDVIDDVADETNLLALNAAIIAAQAGEQGRAFSVVADEIKDLADRVLTSTKEIGALIASLQNEAKSAIGAVERGSRSVASGVLLSADAGLSLEAINRAAQESGTRIASIVTAVREQARAASFVLELTERVRGGVEEIQRASDEQRSGTESIHRSTLAMRDAARQVRSTSQEQAHGAGRIRENVEGVRQTVEQIHDALQEQSAASRATTEFLEGIAARTGSNEESARRLDEVARGLLKHAEALRQGLARFRV